MSTEPILTTAEAARLVGVKPTTLRKWIARGHVVPFGRVGSRFLWTRGHLLGQLAKAPGVSPTRTPDKF
ncbi:MAG: helix-turn-helix domain-containing protein, partial [Myxococcales bacterium]|nr:helix-turn-helix domain-containing protein [Myxococcales bacterium]